MAVTGVLDGAPGRVAMISMHTSPLARAGSGDAGGMNVYVDSVARELAARQVEVDVFTQGPSGTQEPSPGYRVHGVALSAEGALGKGDLPTRVDAFTAAVQEHPAICSGSPFDLVHSHYWLSGMVGAELAERWDVPLVHSMHTLARVKNAARAVGERPEPEARIAGEDRIVADADLLIANTTAEGRDLHRLYRAPNERVAVVHPGVDLTTFAPGDRNAARQRLDLPMDRTILLFVGRLQPLKAPDVAIRALATMVAESPELASQVLLVVCGGPSGTRPLQPGELAGLAEELGVAHLVRFVPPVNHPELADYYRAADVTVVPSFNESFGLVAIESQAVGTPVVAAAVGGLRTAVADGSSGFLVAGHDPAAWSRVLTGLVRDPARRQRLGQRARRHASRFAWQRTADQLMVGYRALRAREAVAAAG